MDWLSAADYVCRLLGVQMAPAKARSPATHGQQRDVWLRDLLPRKVRTRVARIPAAAGTLDKVAKGGSAMGTPRESPAVVIRG